ncbi:virion core cysteine protease [Pteropox virus]|uniref:Virion core cysteine protease n=1 Tax=Pteropox virus TaxID=1873698 RepID=A0A1B1MRC3_9POXV|nr:virion core cysteine protease [Pteropox virus]ANS71137.1 virion core cysteine protease [Pteropox virus]
MDRYTDLVINKIPELGFTNLLYNIYSVVGLCTPLDVSKFATNCNGYVVERFDKSKSAGLVSCIPIGELLALAKNNLLKVIPEVQKPITESTTLDEELEKKKELVLALKRQYPNFKDVINLPSKIPLSFYFKPQLREKVSHAIDFSQMNLNVDDLAKIGIHTGINPKVVKLQIRPEIDAWMTNRSIASLVAPFAYKSEVTYLGQFNFNFMNKVPVYEKTEKFRRDLMYYTIKDAVSTATTRYVMFGFCYFSHWKCAIYDKENKLIAFYDSAGNNPQQFYHYENFYFYSFSDGFNLNKKHSVLEQINCDVDVMMRFFVDCFGAKKGCINYEVNQLLESECGMFSSLFMILCAINPPDSFRSLRQTYTFFRFLADKKMTMLKSILFNVQEQTIETTKTKSEGIKEYVRMERWTKKSIKVLEEKITSRINSLLVNYEPVC